jgi:hypothetical protein
MELREDKNAWTISLKDGRVQMIQIDFRLGFLITDDDDQVWLHIETPARLKTTASEVLLVPDQSVSLAPILPFFNAPVASIRMERTGRLLVEFQRGASLDVAPHQDYEAWQAGCMIQKKDSLFVCAPGGEVAWFKGQR